MVFTGFKTKNSRYYVNQFERTITGGIFGDNVYRYDSLRCIQGYKAYITLVNGQVIETGVVESYI